MLKYPHMIVETHLSEPGRSLWLCIPTRFRAFGNSGCTKRHINEIVLYCLWQNRTNFRCLLFSDVLLQGRHAQPAR